MTDRIKQMFEKRKAQGKKALITFVTAGDPDIECTERLVLEMVNAGADLIELGIPFSDPIAEGPVIQRANVRALSKGIRIDKIFNMVAGVRIRTAAPIVFLMYINSILSYSPDKFFRRCCEAGVDGVIIPDLPYEERGEIADSAGLYGIKMISLVAPTSHGRIKKIASSAEGFLYCVSSLGVTGMRNTFHTDFEEFFGQINKYTAAPTALGFGISTPEQAAELKQYADGIIVGSAIVKLIESSDGGAGMEKKVAGFVASLRNALDN